jgi:hypothetical protein
MRHFLEVVVIICILMLAAWVALEGYHLYERSGKVAGLITCAFFATGGLAIAAIRLRALLRELVDLEATKLNRNR